MTYRCIIVYGAHILQHDYYYLATLSALLSITKVRVPSCVLLRPHRDPCVWLCPQSTVISLALMYRHISIDRAFDACRVEEEHQIEHHGFVYDGHDTARAHSKVQLAAASSFLWLLPASQPTELPKLYTSSHKHREELAA